MFECGVVDFLVNLLNYFMCSLLHAMHFLLVAAVKRANQVSVEQTAQNCVCRKNDSTETEASSTSSSLFYSVTDRIRATQFCVVTNTHNPMKTGHCRINTKPTLLGSETNVCVALFHLHTCLLTLTALWMDALRSGKKLLN